jgi:hypothetical protein
VNQTDIPYLIIHVTHVDPQTGRLMFRFISDKSRRAHPVRNCSAEIRAQLQPGRFYLIEKRYLDYDLKADKPTTPAWVHADKLASEEDCQELMRLLHETYLGMKRSSAGDAQLGQSEAQDKLNNKLVRF